ncbi:MAG: hypothetical protein RL722_2742, partial [Pseudomonadota bacterium]
MHPSPLSACPSLPIPAAVPVRAPLSPTACALAVGTLVSLLGAALAPSTSLAQTTEPPAASGTSAKPPAASLERVEITGSGQSETEARRQSTASKIVIGRDELDRLGDNSVADVLKRLPGVTLGGRPGRGGEIRMRGLGGGYTQILVNGERMPPGFSIDSLTPEQIERIEVSRAPTAETGARAVAGTINIILREDVKRRLNQVHLGTGFEAGAVNPLVSWTRGDQAGDLSYNLSVTGYRQNVHDHTEIDTVDSDPATGTPTHVQHEVDNSQTRRESLHLGGRLVWRLGGGDSLSFMPFLLSSRSTSSFSASLRPELGPLPWTQASRDGHGSFELGRVNLQWQTRAGGGKLELRGGLNRSTSHSDALRDQSGGSNPLTQLTAADVNDRGWSSGLKWQRPLGEDHSIALGWEGEGNRRSETSSNLIAGQPQGADDGDNLGARTLRQAVWAQDEWNFGPRWSAYAGLRWEGISTRSDAGTAQAGSSPATGSITNQSRVLTPLLHSAWKLDDAGKEQIRVALTRSYKSPSLSQLVARQTTVTDNTPTRPDRLGNPDLRPELATGLDASFEHYFSAGGLMSVGVFHRRIEQLIRNRITQQTLDVAGVPSLRWVSQPQNVGDASTSGLEMEAKFRLAELMSAEGGPVPNVDLRSNLSLFRSRVSGVAGPDNRLDQQPRASANLGADWKLRDSPLTLGGNVNWTPAGHVQLASDAASGGTDESMTSAAKRVLDVYALWTF